jgi:hypothetical protein
MKPDNLQKVDRQQKADRPTQAEVVSVEVADELMKLVGLANSNEIPDQRIRDRFPIFCCMQLVPLDTAGKPLSDQHMSVVGKDLSTRGISFSHDSELPTRRVVLCLNVSETARINVEAEITWTRQTPIGLFESGCRLIRKID